MTTPQRIETLKDEIGSISYDHRATYVNGMALRQLCDECEQAMLVLLGQHPAPDALRIGNCIAHPYSLANLREATEFVHTRRILDLVEQSPAFIEAHGVIQPLIDQLAALEVTLAAEVAERGRLAGLVHQAEEAAKERALAEAAADPSLAAARRALAELDAPAPRKGK